jgi:hypothetical protein
MRVIVLQVNLDSQSKNILYLFALLGSIETAGEHGLRRDVSFSGSPP